MHVQKAVWCQLTLPCRRTFGKFHIETDRYIAFEELDSDVLRLLYRSTCETQKTRKLKAVLLSQGCCTDVICLPCRALQLVVDALVVVLCCPCRYWSCVISLTQTSVLLFPILICVIYVVAALLAASRATQSFLLILVQVLVRLPCNCNRGCRTSSALRR